MRDRLIALVTVTQDTSLVEAYELSQDSTAGFTPSGLHANGTFASSGVTSVPLMTKLPANSSLFILLEVVTNSCFSPSPQPSVVLPLVSLAYASLYNCMFSTHRPPSLLLFTPLAAVCTHKPQSEVVVVDGIVTCPSASAPGTFRTLEIKDEMWISGLSRPE